MSKFKKMRGREERTTTLHTRRLDYNVNEHEILQGDDVEHNVWRRFIGCLRYHDHCHL